MSLDRAKRELSGIVGWYSRVSARWWAKSLMVLGLICVSCAFIYFVYLPPAVVGAIKALVDELAKMKSSPAIVALTYLFLGATFLLGLFVTSDKAVQVEQAREAKVDALETRIRDNPAEPKLAWDLARIKLERYLERNLRQVSSIFTLTVSVMLFGMGLVGAGVWRALETPGAIEAPVLAACAGVIVQIIGGTFLIVYRSTMEQAKGYVVVLERINAVGMSINILETIEGDDAQTRNQARAGIARDLLGMYGIQQGGGPT